MIQAAEVKGRRPCRQVHRPAGSAGAQGSPPILGGAGRPLALRRALPACLALALLSCGGGGGGAGGEGEASGPPDRRIQVDAVSYAYHPTQITVNPGTIRFVVRNSGNQVHGFEVEGHGLIEEIPAGQTDSLTVTLSAPGESRISCPVDDHEARGMVGILTVESEQRGGRRRRRGPR